MSYRTCDGGIAASFSEGWQELYPPCEGGIRLTFEQASTLRTESAAVNERLANAAQWSQRTAPSKASVLPFVIKQ